MKLQKVSFDNTDYTEMCEERIHTEEISDGEGVVFGIQQKKELHSYKFVCLLTQ
jgi:hypothetical protein